MTQAQLAWAITNVLYLVSAVVLLLANPTNGGVAVAAYICLFLAGMGWVMLAGMLLADRHGSRE